MASADEWLVECTACDFRGRASSQETAEELAAAHRSATGHALRVRPADG